jgi:energy-coupling factor transport system substrate-specific component
VSSTTIALIGIGLLVVGLVAWERRPVDARDIALVATLGALAAASRVMIPVPDAKPVTAIVVCAGIALGARAGVGVAAVSVLVSNAFLGQGPWTPWQMLAWGLAGASAALAGPLLRRSRLALMAFGLVWGLLYGLILNVYQVALYERVFTLQSFTASEIRGLPFDVTHAVTNVILLGAAGAALIRLLDRYAVRLHGSWHDEPLADATDLPALPFGAAP